MKLINVNQNGLNNGNNKTIAEFHRRFDRICKLDVLIFGSFNLFVVVLLFIFLFIFILSICIFGLHYCNLVQRRVWESERNQEPVCIELDFRFTNSKLNGFRVHIEGARNENSFCDVKSNKKQNFAKLFFSHFYSDLISLLRWNNFFFRSFLLLYLLFAVFRIRNKC